MEGMLKRICFIPGSDGRAEAEEMQRAIRAFEQLGLEGEILSQAPETPDGTLCLCADAAMLRGLRERGFCAAGYSHGGNREEPFRGVPYVVQEPDLVDADSYQKIYQREAGLPWTILETEHCVVREFMEEDLDALYGLYDDAARRFLEPPSPDRERERTILRAYIDRVYGLYGYGHWAVLLKAEAGSESGAGRENRGEQEIGAGRENRAGQGIGAEREIGAGQEIRAGQGIRAGVREAPTARELAGRVGFAALTSAQERELRRMGIRERPDADFGFLIEPSQRGTGLAMEACSAILEYGFLQLGFTCVRADAHRENTPSLRLLEKLGFVPVGEDGGEKIVFLCRRRSDRTDRTFLQDSQASPGQTGGMVL